MRDENISGQSGAALFADPATHAGTRFWVIVHGPVPEAEARLAAYRRTAF
jgi:hypothetical protein